MNCKQVAIVNPWIYLGIQFGEHRRALHWHAALVFLQLEPARRRVQMGGVARKRFYIYTQKCSKSMYCTYRCDEKNIPTIIRKTKTWDIMISLHSCTWILFQTHPCSPASSIFRWKMSSFQTVLLLVNRTGRHNSLQPPIREDVASSYVVFTLPKWIKLVKSRRLHAIINNRTTNIPMPV